MIQLAKYGLLSELMFLHMWVFVCSALSLHTSLIFTSRNNFSLKKFSMFPLSKSLTYSFPARCWFVERNRYVLHFFVLLLLSICCHEIAIKTRQICYSICSRMYTWITIDEIFSGAVYEELQEYSQMTKVKVKYVG